VSARGNGAVPTVWDAPLLPPVLMRCAACGRLQGAGPQCVACGVELPEVERLDGRGVALRQAAVIQLLTPAERDALTTVVQGLGLVGSWWRVRVVHDVFVVLAGQREVERLTRSGMSRTAALQRAAGELGVPWGTLRDRVNALVLEKGVP
jgi:hypothetical protein